MRNQIVFFFFLILLAGVQAQGQIVINEFMAANSSAVYDPDFDESADWLELYNNGVSEVDLSGYYVTDNLSDTTKWMIPEGTILPAGEFLVIWADGMNTGLHTSFKLSSIGEELGIYTTTEDLLDGIIFPLQATDISYGREMDGSDTWVWFSQSTPGASNNDAQPFEGVTYYEPTFSVHGGFYSGTLSVSLSSLGGQIRYTLDGREPTLDDPLYAEPLLVDSTSFIRARVFEENFIAGPTITHSYFFDDTFAERGLPVISLVTDPDFFWDPDTGLYVQDFKPEWEHPLNIEFFENDAANQAVFNERAGVKINGQNSWVLPQKMLGIYFRNQYGAGHLEYPLFADRDRAVFDDFVLRAGGSDWAYSMIRDGVCQAQPQENADVGYQGFRQSIVFINGEYMGIHNIRSRLNDGFVEENYGVASGTYDLIANDGEVEEGDDVAYELMDDLFNADLTVQANFDALDSVVDLQNFADYWITEIWSSNQSWAHNVMLWKPHDGGKWQFLLGDLDRGISGATNDAINSFSVPAEGDYWDNYAQRWLEHVFARPEYAAYFVQRFNDHMYTSFHPQQVTRQMHRFADPIRTEMAYHADRWAGTTSSYGDGIVSVEFWEKRIGVFSLFAHSRSDFMMADLQSKFGMDEIVELGTGSFPADGGRVRINEFMVPGQVWEGPYFSNLPLTLTAIPEPGYDFLGWAHTGKEQLIDPEATWTFLDSGEDPGAEWMMPGFDDSLWGSGTGEFGYGDGDETTVVSYGPDASNKYITTYFRQVFENTLSDQPLALHLELLRDDGVIVYLDGQEIARNNMPDGSYNYLTTSIIDIVDGEETAILKYTFDFPLSPGSHVLAVEMHQSAADNDDLSFSASLWAVVQQGDVYSEDTSIEVSLTADEGFLALYEPNGMCILPQEIAENTTLTIDCSPYMVPHDVVVWPGVTLTIDPGVELWFSEEKRLIVQGNILVNGTESQGVVFKANTLYNQLSWGNVSLENSTGPNTMQYLTIEHATKGAHPVHNNAAISLWYANAEMDHLTLMNNLGNPIFAQYSQVVLTNSVLHSDITGDLINVKYGEAEISHCNFIGNEQPDTDAIDYDEIENGIIEFVNIQGLYGFNSDGIDLGEECVNIDIHDCFIFDCTDKGISVGQGSTATISNVTIVNCNMGVGIKDLATVEMNQVTSYSNVTGVSCFEKNPGFGGGIASVSNSILSNSSESPVIADALSMVDVSYTLYDTDTLVGTGVFWANPLFADAPHFDFQVLPQSPALTAGDQGQEVGSGYHDYSGTSDIMISDIQYFHPINGEQEFLKLWNTGDETVDLSSYYMESAIYHLFPSGISLAPGEKLMLAKDINLFPPGDDQVYQWDSGQLSNGGEKLLLHDNHGIVVDYVKYSPDAPWPVTTLEDKYLTLISASLDNHFAESWTTDIFISDEILPQNGKGLHVYPNPAQSQMWLLLPEPLDHGIVRITDMSGRVVFEVNQVTAGTQVEIHPSLQDGLYLLTVLNGNGVVLGNERFVAR